MKKINVSGEQFVNEDGPVFLIGLNYPDYELSEDAIQANNAMSKIDYLSSFNLNCMSLCLNNWGSRDGSVFPWEKYEMGNLSLVQNPDVVINYDEEKFGQWRTIVQYANEKGIHVFLKLWTRKNQRNWGVLNPAVSNFIEKVRNYFADLSVTIMADYQSGWPEEDQLVNYIRSQGLDFVFIEPLVTSNDPLQVAAFKEQLWSKPFIGYNAMFIDFNDNDYPKYAPILEEIEVFFFVMVKSSFDLFGPVVNGATSGEEFYYVDSKDNVVSSYAFYRDGKVLEEYRGIFYDVDAVLDPSLNKQIVFDPGQSFTIDHAEGGKLSITLNE
jgi:hypothetical protein